MKRDHESPRFAVYLTLVAQVLVCSSGCINIKSAEIGDAIRSDMVSPEVDQLDTVDAEDVADYQADVDLKPGELLTSSSGMRWRFIPAGSFLMGSPAEELGRNTDEGPRHNVEVTRPFWMKETEVTQGEYTQVLGLNPSFFSACGDDCPVEEVTWFDALYFANRLSGLEGLEACYVLADCTGTPGAGLNCEGQTSDFWPKGLGCRGYRLPTEAEWEYAARAGTTSAWYNGGIGDLPSCRYNSFADAIAWYCNNPRDPIHPVGLKPANAWNIRDMAGNVWEWCWDWYGASYYGQSPLEDPLGPTAGTDRTLRGGGWNDSAADVRSSNRSWFGPADYSTYIGFRLVRSL